MPNDADEFVVAANGSINLAPVGSTLPTDMSSLDAAFIELGYATEDGVTFSDAPTVEDIRSWQSPNPTRRLVTERNNSVAFQLQQWNADSFGLAFGGGTWSLVSAGPPAITRFDPPGAQDAIAEYSLAVDWQDGDKEYRLVVPRGNVAEGVETQLTRGGVAVLPITFGILVPDTGDSWNLYTNDPAISVPS
jgi:hypothetical protein